MKLELPVTGREQTPAFLTAKQCREWLVKVPLANPAQAQAILLRQLTLLHRYDMPLAERLAVLEALRRPICEMQDDAARHFAARPLPFAPPEQAALDASLAVWHNLALGYLRCFAAAADGAGDEAEGLQALVAQRTLSVFADWQVDLCRGEQLPDAAYWTKLNQLFAAAETLGVAGRPVDDPVRHGSTPTSPLAAFAECHLLSTASPYELPARHLAWVARWARRWGAKLSLLRTPPEDIRNRAVPLWVDLGGDKPACYAPRPTPGGRWLETTELRKSLIARIALLEQGRAPAELQLGDDVTQPAAGQLLQRALQRWCRGGAERRELRHPASGECRFVAGFDGVHYQLSGGKVFHAPTRDEMTLRREREAMGTFGERSHAEATGHDDNSRLENWEVMDDWKLLDESQSGLRVKRPLKEGVRIGSGQLIAVKVRNAGHFTLGNVRWALRDGSDALMAGIQLFPGEPRPVAMRSAEPGDTATAWRPAYLLPAVAAAKTPENLVLPPGSFRIDRRVEIVVGESSRVVKLSRVLDRGSEFERCEFHD